MIEPFQGCWTLKTIKQTSWIDYTPQFTPIQNTQRVPGEVIQYSQSMPGIFAANNDNILIFPYSINQQNKFGVSFSYDGVEFNQLIIDVASIFSGVGTYTVFDIFYNTNNSLFIVMLHNNSDNKIYTIYSLNGFDWSYGSLLPIISYSNTVVYGNGVFISTWTANNSIRKKYISYDGFNWSEYINTSIDFYSLSYANEGYFSLTNLNKSFIESDQIKQSVSFNLDTWIDINLLEDIPGWDLNVEHNAVSYGNGKFIIPVRSNVNKFPNVCGISTDGVNISLQQLPNRSSWSKSLFNGGWFVIIPYMFNPIVNNNANVLLCSQDGINWIQKAVTLPQSVPYIQGGYNARYFIYFKNKFIFGDANTKFYLPLNPI